MSAQRPATEATSLGKGRALAVVTGIVAVCLALSVTTWVSGTSTDALAAGARAVSGTTASPAMGGLLLVVLLCVAGLTMGGRVLRPVAAALAVLAALGALALGLSVVVSPDRALAQSVATELGRTSAGVTQVAVSASAWAAIAAMLCLCAVLLLVARGSRAWSGMSGRYERPTRNATTQPADAAGRGPRGQVRTQWDELSEGHDPTLRDAQRPDLTE